MKLTPLERAVMLVLMAEAREVSSYDLRARFGLDFFGASRNRLNDLGLVESVKAGRHFQHVLTDFGWRYCLTEFQTDTTPLPGMAGGAMYALMRGMGRFLARSGYSLADVFDLAENPNTTDAKPGNPGEIEDRIRKAYWQLAGHPGAWVRLTHLRPLLGAVPRADADSVLISMNRSGDVIFIPESNQKVLTRQDRAAAVRFGGEDKHLIAIGAS